MNCADMLRNRQHYSISEQRTETQQNGPPPLTASENKGWRNRGLSRESMNDAGFTTEGKITKKTYRQF